MQTLKLIIILVASTFLASLVLANRWMIEQSFAISYLGYRTPEIPLVLLILAGITLGAIITALSMLGGQLRLKKKLREQNKKTRQMDEELKSLRNLPLRDTSQLNSGKENDALTAD